MPPCLSRTDPRSLRLPGRVVPSIEYFTQSRRDDDLFQSDLPPPLLGHERRQYPATWFKYLRRRNHSWATP